MVCHAATVCLCSGKVFPPCLTPSHTQPALKQEVGALCRPLPDLKCDLRMWENLFWIPPGCKAIAVLFLAIIHPSPPLPSCMGMGFDFVMGMAGCSLSNHPPKIWLLLEAPGARDGGADLRLSFIPTFLTYPKPTPVYP